MRAFRGGDYRGGKGGDCVKMGSWERGRAGGLYGGEREEVMAT